MENRNERNHNRTKMNDSKWGQQSTQWILSVLQCLAEKKKAMLVYKHEIGKTVKSVLRNMVKQQTTETKRNPLLKLFLVLFLVPLSHPYSMSRHILLVQIQWHKTDKQRPKQQSTAKMKNQRIKCFGEHFNVVHIFFFRVMEKQIFVY